MIMLIITVFFGFVAGFSVKTKWNDIQTILNYRATKNIIELMQTDNSNTTTTDGTADGWDTDEDAGWDDAESDDGWE